MHSPFPLRAEKKVSLFQDAMERAYAEALKAQALDEVPIGAVVLSPEGEILTAAHNLTETTNDPTAHAEVVAIRRACQILGQKRLFECDLITTLEPCPMCADLIAKARIRTLYIGALDPKGGGLFQGPKVFDHPTCFHKPLIDTTLLAAKHGDILSHFFKQKRNKL